MNVLSRVVPYIHGKIGSLHINIYIFFYADNGTITKAEFDNDWVVLLKIGTQKEANLLFDHADVNDDGVIDSKDLPLIFLYFDTNSE